MKKKIFFTGLFVLGLAFYGQSQCYKKILCKEFSTEYDFTGQSTFATLMPGDTAQFDIILYSGKDYKIMVCSEPKLGDVQFTIFNKSKAAKKEVKEIIKKTEPIYKKDEYGQKVYDGNYKPIIEGYRNVNDTIWITKVSSNEDILFNSKKEGKMSWEEDKIARTRRLIIQVVVPPNPAARYDKGCVSVLVGYKSSN